MVREAHLTTIVIMIIQRRPFYLRDFLQQTDASKIFSQARAFEARIDGIEAALLSNAH